MLVKKENLYQAFLSQDARFDGRFFVGVSSTGIYCRPVCKAKKPAIDNCTFFETAAAAQKAGYRPCLLCRPELAPGCFSARDDLPAQIMNALKENPEESLEALAKRFGYTSRHLRRLFLKEYHVSMVQFRLTCRLLLAKQLLTDTRLSMLDVALACGFNSLRRFNDAFLRHYHLSPLRLRKDSQNPQEPQDTITLYLGYRPPYLWDAILQFLKKRAIVGVELIEDHCYFRTVNLKDHHGVPCTGWLKVSHHPKNHTLAVGVSASLLPVLSKLLTRITRMFDLDAQPLAIYETLQNMETLKPKLDLCGLRLPGCFDDFEMLVRTVLGQQITVAAAGTLTSRLAKAAGTSIETGISGLDTLFFTPEQLLTYAQKNQLGSLGIIRRRADTILALAKVLLDGSLNFTLPASDLLSKLLAIKGIGSWSAGYISMRIVNDPDVFLADDAGINKALPGYTRKEILQLAEPYQPWRSYVMIGLWHSLAKEES